MIEITKPYIKRLENKSRCFCEIYAEGEVREVWFEVDSEYEKYLVTERSDAYVIGLLHWAMLNNHDIKCDIPMTEELHYNISTILIPALVKKSKRLKSISIFADKAEALGGSEVGTGCSCGIDSFDAIYMHYKTDYKNMDVTYLCINNVGAFNDCYREYGIEKVKEERYLKVDEVSKVLDLPIIKTDSNFAQVFPQEHLYTHTYSSMYAVYMLKKMWKIYYYASSGIDYTHFSLVDLECAHYELLSLQCFSTSGLRIYSEGGEKDRYDKTKDIIDFPPAQNYLHVCINKPFNCGKCSKCKRTLVTLDLMNKLDDFAKVFDVEYYRANRNEYYSWLAKQHYMGDIMIEPIYIGMAEREEFKKYIHTEKVKNIVRKIKRKLLG